MQRPVDKLSAAIREFGAREPSVIDDITFLGLLFLGGHYPTTGRVAPPPTGERDKRTVGQVEGHNELEQLLDRLHVLIESRGLDEAFLVVAFVRAIEEELEGLVDTNAPGMARTSALADRFERLATDPDRLMVWNRNKAGDDPLTAGDAFSMAQHARRMATPSVEELRDRREALQSWRELTRPVVDRAALDAWDLEVLGPT
jgi:hypothetical protein